MQNRLYYAEIKPTRIKFGAGILCVLRFETVGLGIYPMLPHSWGIEMIRACRFAHFIRCKDFKRREYNAESTLPQNYYSITSLQYHIASLRGCMC